MAPILPVMTSCFWDNLPPQVREDGVGERLPAYLRLTWLLLILLQRRTRFNLLLLEHGEIYFSTYRQVFCTLNRSESLSLTPSACCPPDDYAVIRYRIKGRTKVKIPGRLKVGRNDRPGRCCREERLVTTGLVWQVSSRSLVFDPVSDVSQPLLRFSYKHISSMLK